MAMPTRGGSNYCGFWTIDPVSVTKIIEGVCGGLRGAGEGRLKDGGEVEYSPSSEL